MSHLPLLFSNFSHLPFFTKISHLSLHIDRLLSNFHAGGETVAVLHEDSLDRNIRLSSKRENILRTISIKWRLTVIFPKPGISISHCSPSFITFSPGMNFELLLVEIWREKNSSSHVGGQKCKYKVKQHRIKHSTRKGTKIKTKSQQKRGEQLTLPPPSLFISTTSTAANISLFIGSGTPQASKYPSAPTLEQTFQVPSKSPSLLPSWCLKLLPPGINQQKIWRRKSFYSF